MQTTIDKNPCWVNGEISQSVSVSDRGLAYGDGVFETIKVRNGQPIFFTWHLERLSKGLSILSFPALDIRNDVTQFLASFPQIQEAVLKIMVTRGEGQRGYGVSLKQKPSVIFTLHPLPSRSSWQNGIHLYACDMSFSLNPRLAGIKHLNRLEQVLARSEWQNLRFQEGLMLDYKKRPLSGTMSNLFIVRKGMLYTPPVRNCGIEGVARRFVLEKCQNKGQFGAIGSLTLENFFSADEVFMTNSLFGIWPVLTYQKESWSKGLVTSFYQSLINQCLYA